MSGAAYSPTAFREHSAQRRGHMLRTKRRVHVTPCAGPKPNIPQDCPHRRKRTHMEREKRTEKNVHNITDSGFSRSEVFRATRVNNEWLSHRLRKQRNDGDSPEGDEDHHQGGHILMAHPCLPFPHAKAHPIDKDTGGKRCDLSGHYVQFDEAETKYAFSITEGLRYLLIFPCTTVLCGKINPSPSYFRLPQPTGWDTRLERMGNRALDLPPVCSIMCLSLFKQGVK